ncbi:MAG: SPFH domain-containing protein [Chlorobia bacterium]|nr:SPFH domain-containing protein [Fimbriimonadaceae bacterium]
MVHEKEKKAINGFVMLLVILGMYGYASYQVYQLVKLGENHPGAMTLVWQMMTLFILGAVMMGGFFIIDPNGSKVLLLFGKYIGTVKSSGFHWTNPFYSKRNISLRAQTLNGQRLKVNDSVGNPVEIAAIVIWQVEDTYKASFDVEYYPDFVNLQSETAIRHLASAYPYDGDDDKISLMRNTDEISKHLGIELEERLALAGIKVIEARLSHLAYAQEIAGVMLRKQQAAAIIAARQRIVDGAVGMVQMALAHLERDKIVVLDDERKAAMVSNLLVVLCSETNVQPVLNSGTLYPG